jgi:hypothetical protein
MMLQELLDILIEEASKVPETESEGMFLLAVRRLEEMETAETGPIHDAQLVYTTPDDWDSQKMTAIFTSGLIVMVKSWLSKLPTVRERNRARDAVARLLMAVLSPESEIVS